MMEEIKTTEGQSGTAPDGLTGAKEPEKMKVNFYKKEDYFLAIVLFTAAWFYVWGVWYFPGSWIVIFTGLFLLAGTGYLKMTGKSMSKEGRLYFFFTLASAVWFLLKYIPGYVGAAYQVMTFYVAIFLHCAGVYWLLTISGNRVGNCLDESSIRDLSRGFCALPFCHCYRLPAALVSLLQALGRRGKHKNMKGASLSQAMVGIICSVPILIVIIPILAAADDSFYQFFMMVSHRFLWIVDAALSSLGFMNTVLKVSVLMIGCYLFGLFYGAFHTKPPKPFEKTTLPSTILISFLTVICSVYGLFFLAKSVSVVSALSQTKETMSYSSFARQGFFELCLIAVINFCLFSAVKFFAEMEKIQIKSILSILGIETLGLILLAFSKMSLYISVYGFTFKRVFTSWFMCVLFFTFYQLLRQVWKKENAIRLSVLFGAVTFLALAYSNPGWWIELLNGYFPA